MWLQHDVYDKALGIITGTCLETTNFAHRILDYWEGWESIVSFDHRTLQLAHDKIAAAWRFRRLPILRQTEFTDTIELKVNPDFVADWLEWLHEEVQSWKHYPYLIRYVIQILKNQNQPEGYRAEDNLNLALLDRYDDVPWRQEIRDAAEATLRSEIPHDHP